MARTHHTNAQNLSRILDAIEIQRLAELNALSADDREERLLQERGERTEISLPVIWHRNHRDMVRDINGALSELAAVAGVGQSVVVHPSERQKDTQGFAKQFQVTVTLPVKPEDKLNQMRDHVTEANIKQAVSPRFINWQSMNIQPIPLLAMLLKDASRYEIKHRDDHEYITIKVPTRESHHINALKDSINVAKSSLFIEDLQVRSTRTGVELISSDIKTKLQEMVEGLNQQTMREAIEANLKGTQKTGFLAAFIEDAQSIDR